MDKRDDRSFKRDNIVLISFPILFVSTSFLVNIRKEMSLPGFRENLFLLLFARCKTRYLHDKPHRTPNVKIEPFFIMICVKSFYYRWDYGDSKGKNLLLKEQFLSFKS